MKELTSFIEARDFVLRNWDQISSKIKTNFKDLPTATYELSKYGWYFSNCTTISEIIEMWEKLKTGEIGTVNRKCQQRIEENIDFIETRIIRLNPQRSEIFKEAFQNHREGKYFSSISLLLTQVDGMSNDRFEIHFYNTKGDHLNPDIPKKLTFFNNSKNNIAVKEFEEDAWNWAFNGNKELFINATAINDSYQKEALYPTFLNRHKILHGLDLNFGNKINSLKTISYLDFINDTICFNLKESKPRDLF